MGLQGKSLESQTYLLVLDNDREVLAVGQMASNSLSGNHEQTGSVLLFDNNMTKLVKHGSGFTFIFIDQYVMMIGECQWRS